MTIWVQTKHAGGRRLTRRAYVLPDSVATLRQLLAATAKLEAEHYHARDPDCLSVSPLQEAELGIRDGRVRFGRMHSGKRADPGQAAAVAVQAYADGLVRVVHNGRTLEGLDDPLHIAEGDTFTFIRLTFLTGAFW